MLRVKRAGQAGQAAVEAALTLPLIIFLLLGTLQLFLALHARLLAHYAAFQATRAGSLSHGECVRMHDAAVLALLPSFRSFLGGSATMGNSRSGRLANAFSEYKLNSHRFLSAKDAGHDGSIVWIMRELRDGSGQHASFKGPQDRGFDQPGSLMRLETRMVYWFPLKIPFANWVLSRMYLARLGLQKFQAANPLLLTERAANWSREDTPSSFSLPGAMAAELRRRAADSQYTFPIETTNTMRMMTPAKQRAFASMNCPW